MAGPCSHKAKHISLLALHRKRYVTPEYQTYRGASTPCVKTDAFAYKLGRFEVSLPWAVGSSLPPVPYTDSGQLWVFVNSLRLTVFKSSKILMERSRTPNLATLWYCRYLIRRLLTLVLLFPLCMSKPVYARISDPDHSHRSQALGVKWPCGPVHGAQLACTSLSL